MMFKLKSDQTVTTYLGQYNIKTPNKTTRVNDISWETWFQTCVTLIAYVKWSMNFADNWNTSQVDYYIPVLERVRTRTRTQWVSPSPSPDSSPDSDSTLVDSDSDSDSTSVDSDSSAVDSDSGLMDSDSDSDSTQVDSDSQWVQVSPVRNVQDKFKLSCAIIDEIRGRNEF